jgi:serine/threonine protein kinase
MQQWPLEQYRIIRCLKQSAHTAAGSSPQVFLIQPKASQNFDDDALVLKFLPATAARDQQQLFANEANVLKQIGSVSHYLMQYVADEALPENHALMQQAGHYLLTPFYAGGSLRDVLQQQVLSPAQVFALFQHMLEAVAALHKTAYIHLDLKPSNFLFKQPDGTGLVLADFALAQSINKPPHQHVLVQGTPKYMSPEQFLGQPLNQQTDFYALGIVLYEMLTGQAPFNASTYQQWAVQHCQQPVPLLAESLQKWQPLIDGLLAKNRQYRFKTIDDIQHCLHSSGIQ